MARISMIAVATSLAVLSTASIARGADAQIACSCAGAQACGADSCEPADEAYCASWSLKGDIEKGSLEVCASDGCYTGTGTVTAIGDAQAQGYAVIVAGSFPYPGIPDSSHEVISIFQPRDSIVTVLEIGDGGRGIVAGVCGAAAPR